MEFTLLSVTSQIIHGHGKCCTIPIAFYLISVYGWHTVEDRKNLWSQLEIIATNISGPWLTMGDFKAILHPDGRVNGQPVHDLETGTARVSC